jgi:hypothetical protein
MFFFKCFKLKKKIKEKEIPEELQGKWSDLKVQDTFIRIIRKDIIDEITEEIINSPSFSIQSLSSGTLKKMLEDYNTIIYDKIIDSIVLD